MSETQQRNVIFMGTPQFSAIILRSLLKEPIPGLNIRAVVTQPDKKSGRGLKVVPSEVKKTAEEFNLPYWQPGSLRETGAAEYLAQYEPDFLIVASYGLILPKNILDLAGIAPINVHASLLPVYRGAAPIQRAIMENWESNAKTGVSIMKMEPGLDTGPVYSMREVEIGKKNYPQLYTELARAGAELLNTTLREIITKNLKPIPQNDELATYAAKITKEDHKIDYNSSVYKIDALVRGVWPRAYLSIKFAGRENPLEISVLSGEIEENNKGVKPGQVFTENGCLKIGTGEGIYKLCEIKPQGRKAMQSKDFVNGLRLSNNSVCGHVV